MFSKHFKHFKMFVFPTTIGINGDRFLLSFIFFVFNRALKKTKAKNQKFKNNNNKNNPLRFRNTWVNSEYISPFESTITLMPCCNLANRGQYNTNVVLTKHYKYDKSLPSFLQTVCFQCLILNQWFRLLRLSIKCIFILKD